MRMFLSGIWLVEISSTVFICQQLYKQVENLDSILSIVLVVILMHYVMSRGQAEEQRQI